MENKYSVWSSVVCTSLSFFTNTKYRWIKYNTHVHNASRQHIIGLLQAVRYACSPLGCVTACVVYGRFDSKIRFENESDGRFNSRFDSNEKNHSQVPTYCRRHRLPHEDLLAYSNTTWIKDSLQNYCSQPITIYETDLIRLKWTMLWEQSDSHIMCGPWLPVN